MSSADSTETTVVYFEADGPVKSLLFMNDLRLDSGRLCDAKLLVNGRQIRAHRLVLAAASSYFATIFTGDQPVDLNTVVPIDDIADEAFDALLEFAYTKQVRIGDENVHSLFSAADYLRFGGVLEACFKFLNRRLGVDNCLSMWSFACAHREKAQELAQASKNIIRKNFADLSSSAEFFDLEKELVVELLQDDELVVMTEEPVYEAAMAWLRHKVDCRGKHIADVLRPVRMQLLSHDYLEKNVKDNELVSSNVHTLGQLTEALEAGQRRIAPLAVGADGAAVPRRPSLDVQEVLLEKKPGQRLGLSIMGGQDRPGHVFRNGDRPGIFIIQVLPEGAAFGTSLCAGDRLLSVNGHDLQHVEHEQAVALLAKQRDQVALTVHHEQAPPGLLELSIKTAHGQGFGLSIQGGVNGPPGNPGDAQDDSIFVSHILPGGAAAKDSRLKVGHKILQVNAIPMLGATHAEALQAMRQSVDCLRLMVCDGFDPSLLPLPTEDVQTKRKKLLVKRQSQIIDPTVCVTY